METLIRHAELRPITLLLTNLPAGSHTLQARSSDANGRERLSPPVKIQVRPGNADFSRAVTLAGANLTWTGNSYYATMEADEPSHPSGNDGCTVWYRWTAPADGVARIAIPTGGGVAVTIFRGNSLTNLDLVSANPVQFGLVVAPGHPAEARRFFRVRSDGTALVRPQPNAGELFGSLKPARSFAGLREEKAAVMQAVGKQAAKEGSSSLAVRHLVDNNVLVEFTPTRWPR